MAAPDPIELSDDVAPWERQPAETPAKHRQFMVYLELGGDRSLAKAAARLSRNVNHIKSVAAAYHWHERAEAHDADLHAQWRREWLTERIKGAQQDAAVLRVLRSKVIQRLQALDASKLSPSELIRLADVVLRHGRTLFGEADEVLATGAGDDPLAGDVAALAALPAEARKARLRDATRAAEARTHALSGLDDD